MATTYNWTFPQLDTAPTEGDLSDVVKIIHWRVTAESDSHSDPDGNNVSTSMYGTATAGEANAENFTAFDSLTQDWCKAIVLENLGKTEAEVQAMLDEKIEAIANPPIVGKTPSSW